MKHSLALQRPLAVIDAKTTGFAPELDRIVEIAGEHKFRLPENPDSKALEEFLIKEKAADRVRFPDLSTRTPFFQPLATFAPDFSKPWKTVCTIANYGRENRMWP